MSRTITLSAILITEFIFLYVFITAFIEDQKSWEITETFID